MSAGADLRQNQIVMLKRNKMAIGRDVQIKPVVVALPCSTCAHFKQLGMNIPSVEVKIQISDFWPNG